MKRLLSWFASLILRLTAAHRREPADSPTPRPASAIKLVATGDDAATVAAVMRSAPTLSRRGVLHLSPHVDVDGRAARFAVRRDAAPCNQETCEYRIVIGPLYRSRPIAERAALRQFRARVGVVRYFVELGFEKATIADCLALEQIDERKVRGNDAVAIRLLRALRGAGADGLLVRGDRSPRVLVIFTHAVGTSIHVLDEAEYSIRDDGSWGRAVVAPAPSHRSDWRTAVRESRWVRRQHGLARLAGELVTALLCFVLAPIVIGLVAADVTIPIWFALLAIFGTVLVTRAVLAMSRSNRLLLDAVLGNDRAIRRLEQQAQIEREYLREAIGDLLDHQVDVDDEVDLAQGDPDDE